MKTQEASKPKKNKGPKILLFDLETAGVQGLCADRGFIICFGYKWLGEKTTHCLTIAQYPGKDIHDDRELLKRAGEIFNEADGIVAHYGEKFDKPYLQSRLLQAKLPPLSENKLTDTCLIARGKLKLSSNRLGNLADFLGCKVKKMEKRGGWPIWWLGALRGDKKAIEDMATYCKQDVDCLEQVFLAMRHIIPSKFLPINYSIGESQWTCPGCGGHRKNNHGYYFSDKKRWVRSQCQTCGRWVRSEKAEACTPKI